MSSRANEDVADLAQLLRLRKLREEAAKVHCDVLRVQREAAERALEEHREALAAARAARRELAVWLSGAGAASMAAAADYAAARRSRLDMLREEAELGVMNGAKALGLAERALAEACAQWQQAQTRTQAVDTLLSKARAQAMQEAEQRVELDAEESRGPAGLIDKEEQ